MSALRAFAVSPTLESEWERLSRYITLAEGFWLGFVFTASASDARALRDRVERLLGEQGRSLLAITPPSPAELRYVLADVFEPAALRAKCIWIEATIEEPQGSSESPWKDAWGWVVLRLNERRERVQRNIPGGLVLVMPPSMKPIVREAASDLWDIRAIVIELDPGEPIKPEIPRAPPRDVQSNFPRDLTGQEYWMLMEALESAFPSRSALSMMLRFRVGRDMDEMAGDRISVKEAAFQVIGVARAEGWLLKLVEGARASNPNNPELVAFCQRVGLIPNVSEAPSSDAAPQEQPKPKEAPLGRLKRPTFFDVHRFRARLGEIEGQVCLVKEGDGNFASYGTGFLVGPDLVITTYHLLERVIKGEVPPSTVELRFDYKRLASGQILKGISCRLSPDQDWLLDASPPCSMEFDDNALPNVSELDYALVRLASPMGNMPLGESPEPGAPKRGWMVYAKPHSFEVDEPLFIAQHVRAEPVQVSIDSNAVIGLNKNQTRVRYATSTNAGGSGAPCFNQEWELVAMHQGKDPSCQRYNQGIPFDKIVARLASKGITLPPLP